MAPTSRRGNRAGKLRCWSVIRCADIKSNLTPVRVVPLRLGMIFSENRLPLFGIMPVGPVMAARIDLPANGGRRLHLPEITPSTNRIGRHFARIKAAGHDPYQLWPL